MEEELIEEILSVYYISFENGGFIITLNDKTYNQSQLIIRVNQILNLDSEKAVKKWFKRYINKVTSGVLTELDKYSLILGQSEWYFVRNNTNAKPMKFSEMLDILIDDFESTPEMLINYIFNEWYIGKVIEKSKELMDK